MTRPVRLTSLLLSLCVLVLSAALDAVPAQASPTDYSVRGIDVSNYQGTINWPPVAAAGTRFSYAKVTDGITYTDPYFTRNYSIAKSLGVFAGGYHFALPDKSTGRVQADFFLDHAGYVDDGRTLPPMLDIEWPWSGSGSPSPCYGLTPAHMVAWIQDFVTRVADRTGRKAMIYTNTFWWNECTGSNASFGAYPLFIANYTGTPTPLPAGWRTWTLWQYASSGALPGDQDVFNGSLPDLTSLIGRTDGEVVVSSLADLTGDGRADIVTRDGTGVLRLYRTTGSTTNQIVAPPAQIGTGWNGLDIL